MLEDKDKSRYNTRFPSGIVEQTESLLYRTKSNDKEKLSNRGNRLELKGMVKPSPFERSEFEWNIKAKQSTLVPYSGPRGGTGCLDTSTGKIFYGSIECGNLREKKKKKPKEKPFFSNKAPNRIEEGKPKKASDSLINQLKNKQGYGLQICETDETFKFKSPVEYVLTKGKEFNGSPLPSDLVKGDSDSSFVNATKLVINNSNLDYVEGYAQNQQTAPTLYAWAVDKSGVVFDNTMDNPQSIRYIGVVYPREQYLRYINSTGYYGVLGGNQEEACKVLKNGNI